MYCRTTRQAWILPLVSLIGLLAPACSRKAAQPSVDRIAILRFENLSQDTSLDWMGRAFSEVLNSELSNAPQLNVISSSRLHSLDPTLGVRPANAPGISAERTLALTQGVNRIGYGEYSVRGGLIEARLTLEDQRTAGMTTFTATPTADVLAAASDLARQLSGSLTPFGTRNPKALQSWISAQESGDATATSQHLEDAIAQDPNFGPPYRLLAHFRIQHQDRAGAIGVLEAALARGDAIPEPERAYLQVEMADIRGDNAAREKALASLVQLNPRDASARRALAELALKRRDFRGAMMAYQKVLEVEPEDTTAWNELGYAAAYAGDLPGAVSALRRYQALRPSDSNPSDSLGDVQLLTGNFREAEAAYLQAARKDPNYPASGETFKAAMAHLMTGDIAGADSVAAQFADARAAAHDPLVESFRAEWSWVSGRRKSAYTQLEAFARAMENGPQRDAASRAYSELTVWNLVLGDRDAAGQTVQKAVALAGPSSVAIAAVTRFLVQPAASAAEWSARADKAFSNPGAASIKQLALAYAYMLGGHFSEATPLLQAMYEQSSPTSNERAGVYLAWAQLQSGHVQEASSLLRWSPIPPLGGPEPFVSFYFPRIFYLRGLAAEKDGKVDQARANYRLFLQLSGPAPLTWGEEKKAQAGL